MVAEEDWERLYELFKDKTLEEIKEMLRDMARWDDFAKRCHLKDKVRSKRFQATKWYSVIYK